MPDKLQEPARPQPQPRGRASDEDVDSGPAHLDLWGGEPLEGSGFESEASESDSEWRDPR